MTAHNELVKALRQARKKLHDIYTADPLDEYNYDVQYKIVIELENALGVMPWSFPKET